MQKDIAQKLLKLRVSFKENVPAIFEDVDDEERGGKVAFRLQGEHSGRVLILKGDRNTNPHTGEWTGAYGMSVRRLTEESKHEGLFKEKKHLKVVIIDTDEWRELDEDEKLSKICEILELTGNSENSDRKIEL